MTTENGQSAGYGDRPASVPDGWVMNRRRFVRLAGTTVLAGALGSLLAACGSDADSGGEPAAGSSASDTPVPGAGVSPGAGAATGGDEFRMIVTNTGLSLDPVRTTAGEDLTVFQNIHSSLVRYVYGSLSELEGDLATEWETSEDGLTWTFALRQGVLFHRDFGDFTSEDVKFHFERHLQPGGYQTSHLQMIDSVEAAEPYSVDFHLIEPFGPFLYLLANGWPNTGLIVSKRAVEQYGDDYASHPIGTGPFMFEESIPRERKVFVANPDYYEGPPAFGRLTMLIIPDEVTGLLAVESGEADMVPLSDPEAIARYQANPNVEVVEGESIHTVFFNMNQLFEPLSDVRVRRALALTINSQEIIDTVFGGYGIVPGCGLVHPKMYGYDPEVNRPWEQDIEQARALLAEAGYANGFRLPGVTYQGSTYEHIGEVLQAQLSQIGVQLEMQYPERAAMTEMRAAPGNGIAIVGWLSYPDPAYWLNMHHSAQNPPNGVNYSRYSDADDLIEQSRALPNGTERETLLRQLQQKICDDVPTIYLFHQVPFTMLGRNVQGYMSGATPSIVYPLSKG